MAVSRQLFYVSVPFSFKLFGIFLVSAHPSFSFLSLSHSMSKKSGQKLSFLGFSLSHVVLKATEMNAFPVNFSVQRYHKTPSALPLTRHSEGYSMFLNQGTMYHCCHYYFDPHLLVITGFLVTSRWGNFTGMTFLRKKRSLMRGFFRLFKRNFILQLKTSIKEIRET